MNGPNDNTVDTHQPKDDGSFLLVVIFSGIALLVGFFVAYLIVSGAGKRLIPGRHNPHPTSQLSLPGTPPSATESPFIFLQQSNLNRV